MAATPAPARKRPAAPSGRDPKLAQMHCARRDLGLDDDAYRAVLERATGKTSGADMTPAQRSAAVAEFRRLGWSAKTGKAPEPRRDHRFALVIWRKLSDAGAVKAGRPALNAFLGGRTFAAKWGDSPTDLRFLTPARTRDVIEALKDMARRHEVELSK